MKRWSCFRPFSNYLSIIDFRCKIHYGSLAKKYGHFIFPESKIIITKFLFRIIITATIHVDPKFLKNLRWFILIEIFMANCDGVARLARFYCSEISGALHDGG